MLAALALAPVAFAGQEQVAAPTAPPTPPTVFSNSRVIVEWTAGADHADKVDARSDAEVEFQGDLDNRSFQLVEVESGQTAAGAIEELRASPGVLLAERDAAIATNSIPNDPEFDQLWGLQNGGLGINGFLGAVPGADVNAPLAWSRTVGDPAIVVADIDSGYRFEHPDLKNVAWTTTATESSMTSMEPTSSATTAKHQQPTATRPTKTCSAADTASTLPAQSVPRAATASASPASPKTSASCRCGSAPASRSKKSPAA